LENIYSKRVSEELKSLLGLIGASYDDVKDKLNWHKSQISKFLSGTQTIKIDTFVLFCKVLEELNSEYNEPVPPELLKPWEILKRALSEQ